MKNCVKIRATTAALLFAFLAFASAFPQTERSSYASALTYGLLRDGAVLYRKSDNVYSPVSSLPGDYFAVILGEADDEGFIPVSYLDVTGAVKTEYIETVDYEPKYKYADKNVLKAVNDGHRINVRSAPDHTADNVIAELDDGAEVYYYGETEGSAQISALGTKWYYVRVTVNDEIVRGYIYTLYAEADPIPNNVIEKVEAYPANDGESDGENEQPGESPSTGATGDFTLGQTSEIIIIVSLCLPVIIIMYLLFRRPPEKPNERHRDK